MLQYGTMRCGIQKHIPMYDIGNPTLAEPAAILDSILDLFVRVSERKEPAVPMQMDPPVGRAGAARQVQDLRRAL